MDDKGLSPAGHRARLRARFEQTGFIGFAEHEVLELLLTLCIPRRDVKGTARQLIHRLGSLKAVLEAPVDVLKETEGMGEVAPVALHIIRAACAYYLQQGLEGSPILNSVDKLADFWRIRLSGLKHEVFEVAFLDKRYGLIKNGVERLQEGDIDRAVVYPRRILSAALKHHAAALVFAHNHPVGRAQPSEEDRVLTQSLIQSARSIGMTVVDHLIIANEDTFSFRRAGLIDPIPYPQPLAAQPH